MHEAYRHYSRARTPTERPVRVERSEKPVAYFSAEFGFHESMPNYSGGLGILSGDHCKSASDLDLNFVAIGLLYRHGYFKQEIDKDGVQQARQPESKFPSSADSRSAAGRQQRCSISVRLLDREVFAKVWQLHVGRINLYLLDTDIAGEQRGRSPASPRSFTAATWKCGCGRKSCSASAACKR